jgi:hypothetical protein
LSAEEKDNAKRNYQQKNYENKTPYQQFKHFLHILLPPEKIIAPEKSFKNNPDAFFQQERFGVIFNIGGTYAG